MIRHLVHIDAKLAQNININGGFAAAILTMRRAHARPQTLKPISLVRAIACASLKFLIQMLDPVINDLLCTSLVKHAFGNQFLGIDIACRWMLPDRLIHKRLGKGRFVTFIMTKAAIAEHIDDNVGIKCLTKFNRNPRCMHNRLGIIAIHMENRCHHHFGHIGWIGR